MFPSCLQALLQSSASRKTQKKKKKKVIQSRFVGLLAANQQHPNFTKFPCGCVSGSPQCSAERAEAGVPLLQEEAPSRHPHPLFLPVRLLGWAPSQLCGRSAPRRCPQTCPRPDSCPGFVSAGLQERRECHHGRDGGGERGWRLRGSRSLHVAPTSHTLAPSPPPKKKKRKKERKDKSTVKCLKNMCLSKSINT